MNARVEDPTLWDNPEQAQAVSRDRSRLEAQVNAVKEMEQGLEDGVMLADMADEEGDEAALEGARADLKAIKAEPALADMAMIRQSRLSVSPVRDAEYATILAMAGEKD